MDRLAVRNSDRHAVRESRRGRPWRQKYGLDLRPHCGPKTGPHYGPLISGPLQNNDLGAQIEDRIAVPNQDRVFDGRGVPVATTLPRIPGPRGHQKAARSRPHCGLKSKPFFRWLGRPRGHRLACGFLTRRRPIVDGAACSARSCRTCCLAWPFRSCVCRCRAVARDSALLYKIGGGRDVCSISRGLRVKLCGTPFDSRPLYYKRAGAVNLKSWKSYCECHPKILQRYPR